MKWTKDGTGFVCLVPPAAVFTLRVKPKGDGRWTWEVYPRGREHTVASGVSGAVGAAKATSENFARRSGLL
jgi:hypothetical protein